MITREVTWRHKSNLRSSIGQSVTWRWRRASARRREWPPSDKAFRAALSGRSSYHRPSLPFPFPSTRLWHRNSPVPSINTLSPPLAQRSFLSPMHSLRTRNLPLTTTQADIFRSNSGTPSRMVATLSSANSGTSLLTRLFTCVPPSVPVHRTDSRHAIRWGHFSTVWLVKDTQYVPLFLTPPFHVHLHLASLEQYCYCLQSTEPGSRDPLARPSHAPAVFLFDILLTPRGTLILS